MKEYKILIVDDEEQILKDWKLMLEEERVGRVFTKSNGKEAVELNRKEGFDLALLDIRLEQEISGTGVLRELLKDTPECYCIMVTAYNDLDPAIEALKLDADDYLKKGILSRDDLVKAVRNGIKWLKLKEENKRLEEEKRESEIKQTKWEARLFALEEMSNALAHYIKNALAVILGSMGFIKSVVKDEKVGERIEKIEAKCEEIDGFVKRLHEVGYIKPVYRSVYIDEIIEVLISLLEDKIREQKVECEIDKESLSKKTIRVDYEYIKEAILNIITNSIEAMPDGGKLKIGGSFSDDFFELRIEDTGFGIFEKDLEEVFKLDFTTKPGWHGLGLPITKRIIEAHKGKIEIKSVVDKGTTCLVMLPIKEVKDV